MKEPLLFLAGDRAYERIREGGLSPDDIRVAVGASGAAKWLGIHGLDAAVFGSWLGAGKEPVHFFGTSIGAWKFAAAARTDAVAAFDLLADAYIHQFYEGPITREQVDREAARMIGAVLPEGAVSEILSHPRYRFTLSAVRCNAKMAAEDPVSLSLGLASAYLANLAGRRHFEKRFARTLFHDARTKAPFADLPEMFSDHVPLTRENFRRALRATGAIPFVMTGVSGIIGAPEGVYRDGGLVDYHPAFSFVPKGDGIVLYPHFYRDITPGWFDKKFPKRRAAAKDLPDVLLLAPSREFVASLPFGKIPDRKDFNRFQKDDRGRISYWQEAVARSRALGDAFLDAVETGRIRRMVRRMG